MKILAIGPFGAGLLPESYARALERNGHQVFRLDSDRAYFQCAWYAGNRVARRLLRARLWERLNFCTKEVVRCVRPNLVLAFKAAYLHPETIAHIRTAENIPIANYYPDNPYCGVPLDPRKTSAQRRDLIDALRQYTRVFTWDRSLVRRLNADSVHAVYLPFAADSDFFSPMEQRPCRECGKRHAVVFVGQHNIKRERHVDAIRKHEVALWGARWKRAQHKFRARHVIHNGTAFGATCAAVYCSADVCLNIVDDLNMPGHNMRTFEIPASGGVMLSTFTEEQAKVFPDAEAAWYYRNPSEIDEILDRLLHDSEALKRTRRAALEIARGHDYRSRSRELVKQLLCLDR